MATKSLSVLRGQLARRKAQAILHLFSLIHWRTWSYRSCMLARLWALTRESVCLGCCVGWSSCGAGWPLRCNSCISALSSAMSFLAFTRRRSRFLTTSSLVLTRFANSSSYFSRSANCSVSSWFCSFWFWKACPTLLKSF